ncbi:MAG: S24 family peptidase [Desulfomonilaceae bacterium]
MKLSIDCFVVSLPAMTFPLPVIAVGNSMSPAIEAGDIILIDRGRTGVYTGGVYAVLVEGEIQIRRLVVLSKWLVQIVCDNPLYPAYEANIGQLRIVGRVIRSHRIWV